jgi:hypothetical protein
VRNVQLEDVEVAQLLLLVQYAIDTFEWDGPSDAAHERFARLQGLRDKLEKLK